MRYKSKEYSLAKYMRAFKKCERIEQPKYLYYPDLNYHAAACVRNPGMCTYRAGVHVLTCLLIGSRRDICHTSGIDPQTRTRALNARMLARLSMHALT
jgi:hypothetical protein